MSDQNDQELLDSQDLDDVELETEEEETPATEPNKQPLTDREKQFLARAKKAESALKTRKPVSEGSQPKFDEVAKAIDEKVELRLEGYTVEDINDMQAYAKGKGISLTEAKANPFVKSAIDARKAERTAEDSTLKPSNRSVMVEGKSADDILRDSKATPEEKQKAFEAKRNAIKPSRA